jgi:hypothetical protein
MMHPALYGGKSRLAIEVIMAMRGATGEAVGLVKILRDEGESTS